MASDVATVDGSIPGSRAAQTAVSGAATAMADAPRVDVAVTVEIAMVVIVTDVIATGASTTGITGVNAIGMSTRVRRSL